VVAGAEVGPEPALARPKSRLRYVVAGAAVGLAAAAKYNAGLTFLAPLVAHGVATGWKPWRRWQLLVLAAMAAVAAFLLTNPFAIAEHTQLVAALRFESNHYRSGHPGAEGGALWFNLSALWHSFGPALLLAPLAAFVPSPKARRYVAVLCAFAVPYFALVSAMQVRFPRNLTPLIVPLAVLAALGATTLIDRLRRPLAAAPLAVLAAIGATPVVDRFRRPLAAGMVAAVMLWPTVAAVGFVCRATDDPWAEARVWLHDHVPAGSKIAVEPYGPYVDPARYRVLAQPTLTAADPQWYRANGYDTLIASEQNFQRYLDAPTRYPTQANAYRQLLSQTCPLFRTGPPGTAILILTPHPC
jgi:MFS family permease